IPALAIIVMSVSSMPFSFSQYASVPATSRNGRPEEKPRKHIVHAAGCVNARHTDGLAGRRTTGSVSIVDGIRGMVGEALIAVDRAGLEALAQRWRDHLVIDAPPHVVGACLATVRPPGVFDRVRLQGAEAVDPAALVEQQVQPCALLGQAAGVLLVGRPVPDIVLRV